MSYDESIAQRVRALLVNRTDVIEKKMFGGLTFLVRHNMCCGVVGADLVVRVGAEGHRAALEQPGAREMDFTGRPLKGLVYVRKRAVESDENLRQWVDRGLNFVLSLPPKQNSSAARLRRRQTRSSRRRES
ncbi:MAG: TfoX/Sxy family protein [Terriglobia bacterium]